MLCHGHLDVESSNISYCYLAISHQLLMPNMSEQVKADKYSMRGCYDAHVSSPETPRDDHDEAVNSLVNIS